MSALMSQHEAWAAARERMGAPIRRRLRLVQPAPTVPVFSVSTAPEDWEERPIAPYDHYVRTMPIHPDDTPAQRILAEVGIKHGYTVHLLRSPDRSWAVCRARNEAVYRLRNEAGLTRGQIGRMLGYRDITTIKSSEQAHAKKLAELSGDRSSQFTDQSLAEPTLRGAYSTK